MNFDDDYLLLSCSLMAFLYPQIWCLVSSVVCDYRDYIPIRPTSGVILFIEINEDNIEA